MSKTMEEDIKPWAARRKSALMLVDTILGKTTVSVSRLDSLDSVDISDRAVMSLRLAVRAVFPGKFARC